MNGMRMHWVNRRAAVGLVVVLTVGFAAAGVAQSVAGQAYGSYVNTLAASSGQSPLAVLPAVSGTDGAEADAQGSTQDVPGTLSSYFLNSMTSGEIGTAEAGAQSTATAANINILSGVITAGEVISNVVSSRPAGGGGSKADGPTVADLGGARGPLDSGGPPGAP